MVNLSTWHWFDMAGFAIPRKRGPCRADVVCSFVDLELLISAGNRCVKCFKGEISSKAVISVVQPIYLISIPIVQRT